MDYAHPPGGSMSAIVDGEFGFATIAHGAEWVPAVVTAAGVTSLSALLGDGVPASVRGLFEDWDGWCDRVVAAIAAADPGVSWQATDVAAFGPPLPDPSNLYLAGANYYDHVKEMGVDPPDKTTEDVFHFMVPSGSLTGTGHDVYRPAGVTQLDWEVEIAVVIGRPADSVAPESALEYVAGYAVANDVSVRGSSIFHPIFGLRFLFAKGQATLTPMGPVIVPARFVPDPMNLSLSMLVNGEIRQESNTAQMIWSIQEQIAYLSAQAPLSAGDVILTGTPAGTAAAYESYLDDGDVMTATVDGLGVLTNRVVGARP
jgi:2-keto-4-pentenoate hydratase/2-oxohepta-3-ene-1,7-dioic acid hydratase in catechol pathway